MPFQKLPFELKAEIARQVDVNDRQFGEWLNLDKEVSLRPARVDDETWIKGVEKLSMVNREMRLACLPLLFDPLKLDDDLSESDLALLPSLPLAKVCRAVSIILFSDLTNPGYTIYSSLSALQHLPACTSASLIFSDAVYNALLDDIGDDLHGLRDQIPGFAAAAQRICHWQFGPLSQVPIARFLALAPLSVRHVELLGANCMGAHDEDEGDDSWFEFRYMKGASYLSQSSKTLRRTLAKASNLETLEMHLERHRPQGVDSDDSDSGSDSQPDRLPTLVHKDWLDEPFQFLPTLASLVLSVENLRKDNSLFHFINRFIALRRLELACAYLPRYRFDTVTLPSLTRLSLTTSTVGALQHLISCFDVPSVTHLTLSVERLHSERTDLPEFVPLLLDAYPSLKFVTLKPGATYVWNAEQVLTMREVLGTKGVVLKTAWNPLHDAPATEGREKKVERVEELLSWVAEYGERVKETGGESEVDALLRSLRGVAGLREMVRM